MTQEVGKTFLHTIETQRNATLITPHFSPHQHRLKLKSLHLNLQSVIHQPFSQSVNVCAGATSSTLCKTAARVPNPVQVLWFFLSNKLTVSDKNSKHQCSEKCLFDIKMIPVSFSITLSTQKNYTFLCLWTSSGHICSLCLMLHFAQESMHQSHGSKTYLTVCVMERDFKFHWDPTDFFFPYLEFWF